MATLVMPTWRRIKIKEKGGAPNLIDMDDTIKGQEVKENEEKSSKDMRLEDEDYNFKLVSSTFIKCNSYF